MGFFQSFFDLNFPQMGTHTHTHTHSPYLVEHKVVIGEAEREHSYALLFAEHGTHAQKHTEHQRRPVGAT